MAAKLTVGEIMHLAKQAEVLEADLDARLKALPQPPATDEDRAAKEALHPIATAVYAVKDVVRKLTGAEVAVRG